MHNLIPKNPFKIILCNKYKCTNLVNTSENYEEINYFYSFNILLFFGFQIEHLKAQNKFENEIKKEQEEKRKLELEKKQKRSEFQQKHAFFEQVTIN